jgi:transcriptional regulator with XRE-family HTH domain
MADEMETAATYLRRKINESGKSISKVARDADTSPVVLNNVLSEKRDMGVDLAIRVAEALGMDLIEFLVGMRILPASTTKDSNGLQYALLSIFDELDAKQKRQLISIAKAIKEDPPG